MQNRLNIDFELKPNDVHIWIIEEYLQNKLLSNQAVLSEDEIERAKKFRFEVDRKTFISGRVALKILLGNYLSVKAESIQFSYNDQNKPEFENKNGVEFNLSNSLSMVAIGITKDAQIGIDIEYNKRPIEIEDIAPKFFSKNEVAKLLSLSSDKRLGAFYKCWTRKESFIKAIGGGLTIPLDQFEVSLLDNELPTLNSIKWNEKDVKNWKMVSLSVGEDYTGAAIVHHEKASFKTLLFKESNLENLPISIN